MPPCSVLQIMASAKADVLVDVGLTFPVDYTLKWTSFKAYKFCLSMLVIVFVWALVLAILDGIEAFLKKAFGGGIKPYIVALGDLVSSFTLYLPLGAFRDRIHFWFEFGNCLQSALLLAIRRWLSLACK
jgi:hypothetical protein